MPHLLAIEWDDAEARLAVAEVRRDSVVLEQAFSVTLESSRLKGGVEAAGPVSMSGATISGRSAIRSTMPSRPAAFAVVKRWWRWAGPISS